MCHHLKQGLANFSVKDQVVYITGFAGHVVDSQLLNSATVAPKAAIDSSKWMGMAEYQ